MTDLVWTPVRVKIGQIRPWQDNPRMSTKAQALRLLKSFDELGQIQTVAIGPAVDGLYPLYDGHQRVSALLTVKPDSELTALQSNRPLTEDERRKVSILLHTATGSWSWDALSSWSAAELREWGMDESTLKGWNNDANNLKELLNAENADEVDAEPQIDRAAELQKLWQTETGQLWRLGEHRLLIGDCTVRENVERLMGGERADLNLQDPPYGIGKDYEGEDLMGDEFSGFHSKWLSLACEFSRNDKSLFYIFTGSKTVFMFSDVIRKFIKLPRLLIWYRPDGHGAGGSDYFYNFDPIFYGSISGKNGVFEFADFARDVWIANKAKPEAGGFEHSTVKALEVVEQPIKASSKTGDIVLDLFAGSGTTIIAAHNLNRRCFACEISEKYGAVILERFYEATRITPELVNNG